MRRHLAAAAALLLLTAPAAAQSVADFYRGRTVTISVGLSAGGGYDLHARVLARFLGRHLPGAPAVVVKNAPGAGGLTLVNALYSTLARDGTELATFERGILLEPLLDPAQARFDPLRFSFSAAPTTTSAPACRGTPPRSRPWTMSCARS